MLTGNNCAGALVLINGFANMFLGLLHEKINKQINKGESEWSRSKEQSGKKGLKRGNNEN